MAYEAKDSAVNGRQLEVQSLVIPLRIVGNATAASVSLQNDEPGFVFLRSSSVDQITAELNVNEVATYSAAPNDAAGVFQVLIKINEPLGKICSARLLNRSAAAAQAAYLGSATGITTGTGGGQALMVLCDSTVDFTGANTLDACLHVDYVVAD
jgi:hypothetical protein